MSKTKSSGTKRKAVTDDSRLPESNKKSPTLTEAQGTDSKPVLLPQSPASNRKSVCCWAHTRSGTRCQSLVRSREEEPIPIPYCNLHLKSGDHALKVVSHPIAGKCLIARYDLPPKYRMAFYGIRGKCPTSDKEDRSISYYPPNPMTGYNTCPKTKLLKTDNYNGVLNPKHTGDVIQYAACPGPSERQNIRSTFRYWGKRNGRLGGLEFVTLEQVPKNTQLCHWYGAGWWSARKIKRIDVGTKRYPAPKRHGLAESSLSSSSSS